MPSISTLDRSWFPFAALAAAVALYTGFVFVPGARKAGMLSDEIRLRQEYISQAESLDRMFRQTELDLERCRQADDAWNELAPSPAGLAVLYGQISRQAQHSGATATRFEPQPPIELNLFRRIPLTIGSAGTFAEVFRLLGGLESLTPAIWVEELELKGPREFGQKMNCDLKLAVFAASTEKTD